MRSSYPISMPPFNIRDHVPGNIGSLVEARKLNSMGDTSARAKPARGESFFTEFSLSSSLKHRRHTGLDEFPEATSVASYIARADVRAMAIVSAQTRFGRRRVRWPACTICPKMRVMLMIRPQRCLRWSRYLLNAEVGRRQDLCDGQRPAELLLHARMTELGRRGMPALLQKDVRSCQNGPIAAFTPLDLFL